LQCARHPDVETELGCSRCGTPICPKCLVYTPVGTRCSDCARVNRLPTYNIPTQTFLRAGAAALTGGLAIGFAWAFFNVVTNLFWGVPVGIAIGYGVGELVSLASNRKAGPPLQAIAVSGVVLAFLVRTGTLFLIDDWVFETLRLDIAGFIAAGVAVFVAAGRLR
jgi:hypothetical protein